MGKKAGANQEDIDRILELEAQGYSAMDISDMLHIEVDVVEGFMSGDVVPNLDGDTNADTVIHDDSGILITEDADSINIDTDGDGNADVILPKD